MNQRPGQPFLKYGMRSTPITIAPGHQSQANYSSHHRTQQFQSSKPLRQDPKARAFSPSPHLSNSNAIRPAVDINRNNASHYSIQSSDKQSKAGSLSSYKTLGLKDSQAITLETYKSSQTYLEPLVFREDTKRNASNTASFTQRKTKLQTDNHQSHPSWTKHIALEFECEELKNALAHKKQQLQYKQKSVQNLINQKFELRQKYERQITEIRLTHQKQVKTLKQEYQSRIVQKRERIDKLMNQILGVSAFCLNEQAQRHMSSIYEQNLKLKQQVEQLKVQVSQTLARNQLLDNKNKFSSLELESVKQSNSKIKNKLAELSQNTKQAIDNSNLTTVKIIDAQNIKIVQLMHLYENVCEELSKARQKELELVRKEAEGRIQSSNAMRQQRFLVNKSLVKLTNLCNNKENEIKFLRGRIAKLEGENLSIAEKIKAKNQFIEDLAMKLNCQSQDSNGNHIRQLVCQLVKAHELQIRDVNSFKSEIEQLQQKLHLLTF